MELDDYSWLVGMVQQGGKFSVLRRSSITQVYAMFRLESADKEAMEKVAKLLDAPMYDKTTRGGAERFTITLIGEKVHAVVELVWECLTQRKQQQILEAFGETTPRHLTDKQTG
jgi:hypothetical protein